MPQTQPLGTPFEEVQRNQQFVFALNRHINPFPLQFSSLQPFQPVRRVFSPTPEQTRFVQRQLPCVANAQLPQIPEARTQSNVEREEEKLKVLHKAEKAAQHWERRYITTKNVLDSTNIQLGQARIELDQLKMEVVRKRKQNRESLFNWCGGR